MAPVTSYLDAEQVLEAGAGLAESPIWSDNRLSFVDIKASTLWHWDPSTSSATTMQLDMPVSAVGAWKSGTFIAASESGFASVDVSGGHVEEIARVAGPRCRMNDGKVDFKGRFWAGSASLDQKDKEGHLFVLDVDGKYRSVLSDLGMSNGLGWLSDQTLVHVDTLAGELRGYTMDESGGGAEISNSWLIARVPPTLGLPDGLAIDDSDCIWLAIWGAGEVRRFTPKGDMDTVVRLPTANATSCCFGGEHADTLYVTTATDISTEDPLSGNLFAVSPGVGGQEPRWYRG